MPTRTLSLLDLAEDYTSHDDALVDASKEGWTLNTYTDANNEGEEGVTVEYAQQAAQEDPGLVYLTREIILPDTSHTPWAIRVLEDLFRLSHYTAPEVHARFAEAARDALRDVCNEATPDDEDDTNYRRLCKETGISPV